MRAPEDSLALLALASRPKFSWASTRLQIEQLGSPTAVLDASYDGQLINGERDGELQTAASMVADLERRSIHVSTVVSDDYPAALRTVHDAPPVLYWQGALSSRDNDAVAIVGTRQPSQGGEAFARDLARILASHDVPVVSGLARGIDTVAIRASLEAGGRTVAVIGTGHGVYYPRENASLQDELARDHLLLSQFPPGASASKRSFPMRNVVMSGFSSATVIAEAGETSGTRIQARAALKHGRPLILSAHVARTIAWAQDILKGGYDVSVAEDANDAADLVLALHRRRDQAAQGSFFGALLAS
ncbi:DNA-processing protein DprA [Microbacterium foliorum]|uniref:DNA-processing protein DprA n=1 Tax=Microbacterium foliorum TaxID=104336 RepID=A0A4Y5YRZ9_9MICO|nr:DNA-processing protein DprA [Microbacterium foliorum]QDE35600.1 DNA-processing protein DprA [Microbacterium foliorum]